MSSQLQHSPADILRYLLVQGGYGTLPEADGVWPIAAMQELPDPDNTITLYDTTGKIDGVTQPDGEIQEHYGVQIRLRSTLGTNGWTKLSAIRAYLSETIQNFYVTIDSIIYRVWCVTNIGSIISLGKDGSNSRRRLYTLNVTTVVTQEETLENPLVTEDGDTLISEDGSPLVWI